MISVASSLGKFNTNPIASIDGPEILESVEAVSIDAPDLFSAVSVAALDTPELLTAITVDGLAVPSIMTSLTAPTIDTPNIFTSVAGGTISTPTLITAVSIAGLDTPDLFSAVSIADIDTPDLMTAESVGTLDTPDLLGPIAAPTLPAPTALTAQTGTLTTPPFALNHARILYDNILFNYTEVSSPSAGRAVVPTTVSGWEFTATTSTSNSITYTMPVTYDVDTICICSHNLGSAGSTVEVLYDDNLTGGFISLGSKVATSDNAIMFHFSSSIDVRKLRISVSGGAGSCYVRYVSAGIALQMQRPFFGGHEPITDSVETTFNTSTTEAKNILGRNIKSQGMSTSYSWENIDDTWYRAYFEPFKKVALKYPFVMAWNLDEYPDDVALCYITKDIAAAAYSGTRKLRSISFDVRGAF